MSTPARDAATDYDREGEPAFGRAWNIMREVCEDPYKQAKQPRWPAAPTTKAIPPSLEVFKHALTRERKHGYVSVETFAQRVVERWKTNGAI